MITAIVIYLVLAYVAGFVYHNWKVKKDESTEVEAALNWLLFPVLLPFALVVCLLALVVVAASKLFRKR